MSQLPPKAQKAIKPNWVGEAVNLEVKWKDMMEIKAGYGNLMDKLDELSKLMAVLEESVDTDARNIEVQELFKELLSKSKQISSETRNLAQRLLNVDIDLDPSTVYNDSDEEQFEDIEYTIDRKKEAAQGMEILKKALGKLNLENQTTPRYPNSHYYKGTVNVGQFMKEFHKLQDFRKFFSAELKTKLAKCAAIHVKIVAKITETTPEDVKAHIEKGGDLNMVAREYVQQLLNPAAYRTSTELSDNGANGGSKPLTNPP